MSSASAKKSFQFALQRELVKLYLVIFFGIVILSVIQEAFHVIAEPYIREVIKLPFRVVGWGLIMGGIVGILHFVFVQTTASPSGR